MIVNSFGSYFTECLLAEARIQPFRAPSKIRGLIVAMGSIPTR